MTETRLTRRSFLARTAAAAGAAAGFPGLIPASALGADGAVAPSDRIVFGAIGTGSMGMGDLHDFLGRREVQFVAVCDVDRRHRENAKRTV
ncbi:MAG: twin-arginine translocation signal domain-containing protein, partial [Planctomycetes bacterium]|nr:twin-arginine translocation signal domain-containing protein [Planctomycetota bacterium]